MKCGGSVADSAGDSFSSPFEIFLCVVRFLGGTPLARYVLMPRRGVPHLRHGIATATVDK